MGRRRSKAESTNDEEKYSLSEESDVNKNNTDALSALNLNEDQGTNEKTEQKVDVFTFASEASGSSSRPRRRCNPASFCPPYLPSPESQPSIAKKIKKEVKSRSIGTDDEIDKLSRVSNNTNQSLEDSSDDENDESNVKESSSSGAVALDKLKFDVKIDPNIVDRYTDSGFTAEGSTPESPETRRQRIDIISRQCRLHPANKKYNQGPVENPPLVTPGKMVGYTPGGQRHEVDLNFDRPTWFNSEYARMQWDYATRVNVSRMFHELETGSFLADGLDPEIERRYFAVQEMATKQATEQYEEIGKASSSHANGQATSSELTEEEKEHLQLLEAENELLELNKFGYVRLQDFPEEIDRKLRKAHDLTLTPLMIKKNPAILDTLDALATQCFNIDVVLSARALLDKIKGLFQVPENKEFREFFAEEVEKLKEKTEDMSGFDILMMTEEPQDDADDTESLTPTLPETSQPEVEQDSSESEEWVPIDENGEVWADSVADSNHISSNGPNSDMDLSDVSEDDGWTTYDENEDSSSEVIESDNEIEFEDLLGTLISGMLINGGYSLTITFNHFEFI